MSEATLLKTVKSLDETGPGKDGEHIATLWQQLAKTAKTSFHAAEESTLRWLLKSMNKSSQDAECLRRFPQTWHIIESLVHRIPPFSLAKSLADRRFSLVLQQSLQDISRPPVPDPKAVKTSKRKRTQEPSFNLDSLRSEDGCITSASALFSAMHSLLRHLQDDNANQLSSHDKMGIEHIRSLFCVSNTEALTFTSPSLIICHSWITAASEGDLDSAISWIDVILDMWDLHLRSGDESDDISTNLFNTCTLILHSIEEPSANVPGSIALRWRSRLKQFLHRNLIIPARNRFSQLGELGAIQVALAVSRGIIHISAPVLMELALDVSTTQSSRKNNTQWLEAVFSAVENSVEGHKDCNVLMQTIFQKAIEKATSFGAQATRNVVWRYGFTGDKSDWKLLDITSTSEPGIFQSSADGQKLLTEVCNRILSAGVLNQSEVDRIMKIIEAILAGFLTARNFLGFTKLWFDQLCKSDTHTIFKDSPWTRLDRRLVNGKPISTLIEEELSPRQVGELLDWLGEQNTSPRSLCVVAGTIAEGIHSEEFQDAVGARLSDLVLSLKDFESNPSSSLRWSVCTRTMVWLPAQDRCKLWDSVKETGSKTLLESPLRSRVTLEAFKCCSMAWVSMMPDHSQRDEPSQIVVDFLGRLGSELNVNEILDSGKISTCQSLSAAPDDDDDETLILQQYVMWCIGGCSRLLRLYFRNSDALPLIVRNVLQATTTNIQDLSILWKAVLENENIINDPEIAESLIQLLLSLLENAEHIVNVPGQYELLYMQSLCRIPADAITRSQRERIMKVLDKSRERIYHASGTSTSKKYFKELWTALLTLFAKLMSQPTFHSAASFQAIVKMADEIWSHCNGENQTSQSILEMTEKFSRTATVTFSQMAKHMETRSEYFEQAKALISEHQFGHHIQNHISPYRIVVIGALITALSGDNKTRLPDDLAQLREVAEDSLRAQIASLLSKWAEAQGHSDVVKEPTFLFASMLAVQSLPATRSISGESKGKLRTLEMALQAVESGNAQDWMVAVLAQRMYSGLSGMSPMCNVTRFSQVPVEITALAKEMVEYLAVPTTPQSGSINLQNLLWAHQAGHDTDGQMLAIQEITNIITNEPISIIMNSNVTMSEVQNDLLKSLLAARSHDSCALICRSIQTVLNKHPQALSQWSIEATLSTTTKLAKEALVPGSPVALASLCEVLLVVTRKHRLRLEGHYHVLVSALQSLLRLLIANQASSMQNQKDDANLFSRLIHAICEPTVGAVSHSKQGSRLDSATDAAKRSAGQHMYLLLMEYVKLQLENRIPRSTLDVLESPMNSIFDITPPETRKILNDAMDASSRAILREMFKRYTKFGKWAGV